MLIQPNQAFYIAAQTGVTTMMIGPPGVGKTESMFSFARALDRSIIVKELGNMEPEQVLGYGKVGTVEVDGSPYACTEMYPLEWMLTCLHGKKRLLFLDEFLNCSPTVQKAFLSQLKDGFGPDCLTVLATNPVSLATDGHELKPAAVNRICHLDWEVDWEGWAVGMRNGGAFPLPRFDLLPDDWREGIARKGQTIMHFLDQHGDLKDVPPKNDQVVILPYPTPRSWFFSAKLMAAAESVNAPAIVHQQLLKGMVGEAAASQYFAWLRTIDLPDPETVLKKPRSVKWPKEADMVYQIMDSCRSAVEGNQKPERWEALCDLAEWAWESDLNELAMAFQGKVMAVSAKSGYAIGKRGAAWKAMLEARTDA